MGAGLSDLDPDRLLLLWPEGAPGAVGDEEADRPLISLHLPDPEKANGTAVIVCPGGGYVGLAEDYEGIDCAEWLRSMGVAAFVLRYRVSPRYRHPAPLQDIQRAIRTVRSRSAEWGVDPNRIGIWGYSAGGHLCATAGTHFDDGNPDDADPIERPGCRPSFLILGYPLITFLPPYTHPGCIENLLGENQDESLIQSLSNETMVTPETPPTFIFQTDSDECVQPENSVLFYLALRKAGVPAELHIYERGPHGVGMAPDDPILSEWPKQLRLWLWGRGLLGE